MVVGSVFALRGEHKTKKETWMSEGLRLPHRGAAIRVLVDFKRHAFLPTKCLEPTFSQAEESIVVNPSGQRKLYCFTFVFTLCLFGLRFLFCRW